MYKLHSFTLTYRLPAPMRAPRAYPTADEVAAGRLQRKIDRIQRKSAARIKKLKAEAERTRLFGQRARLLAELCAIAGPVFAEAHLVRCEQEPPFGSFAPGGYPAGGGVTGSVWRGGREEEARHPNPVGQTGLPGFGAGVGMGKTHLVFERAKAYMDAQMLAHGDVVRQHVERAEHYARPVRLVIKNLEPRGEFTPEQVAHIRKAFGRARRFS